MTNKRVYYAHVIIKDHFLFGCKICHKINVVFSEYHPYIWYECDFCRVVNCVCPDIEYEKEQDRINPVDLSIPATNWMEKNQNDN